MKRTCLALSVVSAAFVLAVPAQAWNDVGHKTVLAIAYANLSPTARARFDAIMKADPRHRNMGKLATWPDDERTHPTWHYVNIPFRPDGKLGAKPEGENVVTAVGAALAALKKPGAQQRADALASLVHFVGDVHQPMHCVTRFGEGLPATGDKGGTLSYLTGDWKSVHELWDNALNLSGTKPDPGAEAKALMAKHARAAVVGKLGGSVGSWAFESYGLAVRRAYSIFSTPGAHPTPTQQYLAVVASTSEQRIALAGYRLAELLNKALGG